MAIGDRTTLVTQTYVEQTYDKKADGTDDLNTYDSTKRASAKAIALVNDRVDAIELALADYQTLIQVNNIIQTTIGTVAEFEASLI